jgi:hypothetical protein
MEYITGIYWRCIYAKNIVFTFASLITLGLTLLVIAIYFNGIDIVEDDLLL